jgi:stage V sporulation protein K
MEDKFKGYGGFVDPSEEKGISPQEPSKSIVENSPPLIQPVDPYDLYSKSIPVITSKSEENTSSEDLQKVNENVETKEEKPKVKLEDLLIEMDNLVGLQHVKGEIRALLQFVHVQELRRLKKISVSKPSLHSVFYGSPGTGKTTVARLYGQMLAAMGLLSKGHLVETDRSGLIGGYVGQTALKTDEMIKEALGGVLFIDEAYALSKGDINPNDYGQEAIAILLKRMEDYRDDLVVIVAGYPEPMANFLSTNEGLKSRFSTYIHFEDYSPQEMAEIFVRICKKENYSPTEEALEFVFTSIDYNYSIRDKTFGNARFVRNLFEAVIKNQALRIGSTIQDPSPDELKVILPGDIPFLTPTDTKVIQTSEYKKGDSRNE